MDGFDQQQEFSWQHQYFHALTPAGKLAFIYLLDRVLVGRDYVSLERMVNETGLSLAACEQYVTQFAVDRELPRMTIVEELVG